MKMHNWLYNRHFKTSRLICGVCLGVLFCSISAAQDFSTIPQQGQNLWSSSKQPVENILQQALARAASPSMQQQAVEQAVGQNATNMPSSPAFGPLAAVNPALVTAPTANASAIETAVAATNTSGARANSPAVLPEEMSYHQRSTEGWFWYNENIPEEVFEPEPEEKPATAVTVAMASMTARQQLEQIQNMIEEAKARAVLYPTAENLQDYMRLNKWALNQAEAFSENWQSVMWTTPELDHRLEFPTTTVGRQIYNAQEGQARRAWMREVAKSKGLFFFFRSTCPYCHQFAPILKRFSERYGFEIVSVSLDGGTLPDFPNPRHDTHVATELGVEVVPTLFLVDPATSDVIQIANGLVAEIEIEERIYELTYQKPASSPTQQVALEAQ